MSQPDDATLVAQINERLILSNLRYQRQAEASTIAAHTLQQGTGTALTQLPLDDLLAELLRRTSDILGADAGAILLIEPGAEALAVHATVGVEPALAQGVRIPVGRGVKGRIAAEGQPILLDEVDSSELNSPLLLGPGIVSLLGAPLLHNSQIVGVLVTCSRQPHHFNAGDVHLLQLMADQVAIAVDHARLLEEAAETAALRRAQELQSVLLSSLSHDFRTPLTSIKARAEELLAQHANPDPEAIHEALTEINQEVDRLTRFVARLLDLSRLEAGDMSPRFEWCSLTEVIDRVLESQNLERRIHVELPAYLPDLYTDEVMVEQILINLVENADKFSPAGASIDLVVEVKNNQVRLDVSDRGLGVPPADRERIFEKFYRVAGPGHPTPGRGVGLAIARGFAQALQGSLEYVSRPGGGSIFVLTLPLTLPQAGSP